MKHSIKNNILLLLRVFVFFSNIVVASSVQRPKKTVMRPGSARLQPVALPGGARPASAKTVGAKPVATAAPAGYSACVPARQPDVSQKLLIAEMPGFIKEDVDVLQRIKAVALEAKNDPARAKRLPMAAQFQKYIRDDLHWIKGIPGAINNLKQLILNFDKAIVSADQKQIAQTYDLLAAFLDSIIARLLVHTPQQLAQQKEQEAKKAGILTIEERREQAQEALERLAYAQKPQEMKSIEQHAEDQVEKAIYRGDIAAIKKIVPSLISPTHLLRRYKFVKTPLDLARDFEQAEIVQYLESIITAQSCSAGIRAKNPVKEPAGKPIVKIFAKEPEAQKKKKSIEEDIFEKVQAVYEYSKRLDLVNLDEKSWGEFIRILNNAAQNELLGTEYFEQKRGLPLSPVVQPLFEKLKEKLNELATSYLSIDEINKRINRFKKEAIPSLKRLALSAWMESYANKEIERLQSIEAAEKAPQKLTDELAKIEKNLFDTYDPDKVPNACRPGVIMGQYGKPELNHGSFTLKREGNLACLIKGYKTVASEDYYSYSPELRALMESKGIGALGGLIFSPAGKIKALLHAKSKTDLTGARGSFYLTGYLYDYPDKDIEAFYIQNQFENFERDKKLSLEWVEKNKIGIEDWARENIPDYAQK